MRAAQCEFTMKTSRAELTDTPENFTEEPPQGEQTSAAAGAEPPPPHPRYHRSGDPNSQNKKQLNRNQDPEPRDPEPTGSGSLTWPPPHRTRPDAEAPRRTGGV
ncbi:hypothetical protein EYF80_006259 [Liparis tanakae]|uniref:Uncharacterized protein n=1 Tax=Liparis tanakae TaxID=230148 RepID=A0A4Z2J0S8_9TELE|nr:hypothetical protein EYF80_006259 [Liparis tanakae]